MYSVLEFVFLPTINTDIDQQTQWGRRGYPQKIISERFAFDVHVTVHRDKFL